MEKLNEIWFFLPKNWWCMCLLCTHSLARSVVKRLFGRWLLILKIRGGSRDFRGRVSSSKKFCEQTKFTLKINIIWEFLETLGFYSAQRCEMPLFSPGNFISWNWIENLLWSFEILHCILKYKGDCSNSDIFI